MKCWNHMFLVLSSDNLKLLFLLPVHVLNSSLNHVCVRTVNISSVCQHVIVCVSTVNMFSSVCQQCHCTVMCQYCQLVVICHYTIICVSTWLVVICVSELSSCSHLCVWTVNVLSSMHQHCHYAIIWVSTVNLSFVCQNLTSCHLCVNTVTMSSFMCQHCHHVTCVSWMSLCCHLCQRCQLDAICVTTLS